ncbi:GrpB family protein [Paenibacillus lautus]|uniref:GrpB family protein n=1 Tax=Paenibacillus lautus TaxID=1401 RepID=UPI002DB89C0D|nr:GrpB family protein [Paenibacillus lautus]MEC0259994.1 GrpB family protein [Paenibacillus lautus]
MTIDEAIHLESYDKQWADRFSDEHQTLIREIGPYTAAIEHFGSTSVPGMTAKPIIDILVGVENTQHANEIIPKLTAMGYEDLGEAGIPGRLYLRKRGRYAYNVHIVFYRGDMWNHNIMIREYLRAHAVEAERYSEIKRRIVTQGTRTLLQYSNEKHAYVEQLLARAKAWMNGRTS